MIGDNYFRELFTRQTQTFVLLYWQRRARMDNITFKQPRNLTEDEARETFEAIRWSDGAVYLHCKSKESYELTPKGETKTKVCPGVYKCKACRKQFTVTVGTIFARILTGRPGL